MILLVASSSWFGFYVLLPLMVGFCVLIGAHFLIEHLKEKHNDKRFKRLVDAIAPNVEKTLNELEELFKPNRRITQDEIDQFIKNNSIVIEDATILDKDEKKVSLYLYESGIDKLIKETLADSLEKKKRENNHIYDSIKQLGELAAKALNEYKVFNSDTHYFTDSEMKQFGLLLNEGEMLSKSILPKYEDYLGEEEKRFLNFKDKIQLDRKMHNEEFVRRELTENKTYFDTVLGTYPLDPQQRDSIVKLEDNCLVIASAGSGKTSTILGKAKYLVEKRNIDPSKILLITYTRKAANELHERMKIEGMTCSTFHALAYQIIAKVTGQAPSICDADVPLRVFHKLIETDHDFLHSVNNYIINQQSLMGLEHEYNDAFSYFEDRRKYGIQALFPDVDGKIIFTRSEEEKRLVSILSRLGVPFRYENPYQVNTTTPERRQYRPDFTIYYQDSSGQWKWLYLEHFAIDSVGNVPRWFGEGSRGGWRFANQRYNEGIEWKRSTHKQYGTILIETTSADFWDGTVETKLREQLARYGIPIKERSDEELYELMVNRNRKLEKSVYTLILSFITLMKANEKTIDGLLKDLEESASKGVESPNNQRSKQILTNVIKPFYNEYQKELSKKYEIDFTDAIIQATELCRDGLWKDYEYILVDEFQDISVDRYKFLQALRSENPKTKLYCVGDDWQSIFRFAGSDMSLVYEFEKYFGYTEQCKIETTYRFHQPLIDKSSEFIMRNKEQKEKTIKTPSNDSNKTYLNFVKCDGEDKDGVLNKVKEIVATIPTTQSILLLGRYNYDAMSVGFSGKIDMKETRIMVNINGRDLPFLSVHSAKGLEADNVILVNCNQGAYGFPSLIEDDPILDFVLSKSEGYPFAEERRLFYVAMTRAKKRMYILYDQKRPSPFISEFLLKIEVGSYLCPRCLEGKMVAIKDGQTANGEKYRSFVCSNNEGGCDFFETEYGDLTPPGIRITEEMTAQDVEKLREKRRNARLSFVPKAPQTNFAYGTKAPVFPHKPIGGFQPNPFEAAPPLSPLPPTEESLGGSADDLPF